MSSSAGLTELADALQQAALLATRSASSLPSDLAYERTLSRNLAKHLDAASARSLGLIGQLLQLVRSAEGLEKRAEEDEADLIDNYGRAVTEVVDALLERADSALDRAAGRGTVGPAPVVQNAAPTQKAVVRHNRQLAKPQLRFKRAVNNARDAGPFVPLLSEKAHSAGPLDLTPVVTPLGDTEETVNAIPHPYRAEIEALAYDRALPEMEHARPSLESLDDEASFRYVDDLPKLRKMIKHLRKASEVAVDLEHHDIRSYYGITCLMQISSPTRDFIVDVLDPEVREGVKDLNEVFADPSILKVFHGAESDMIWLQRDLGLYVVNLFDTGHAARVLGFPRASLAYLLDRFVGFQADKRYQVADWRTRPLTPEMMRYARADTHFLLYVASQLRQQLALPESATEQYPAPLRTVLERSAATALQLFFRIPFEQDYGFQRLLEKWHKDQEWHASSPEFAVFYALYDWRDRAAREMDDSINYVLPNATLLALAQQQPKQARDVSKCLDRNSPIASRAAEIAALIEKTLDEPVLAPKKAAPGRKRRVGAMEVDEPSLSGTLARVLPSLFGGAAVPAGPQASSSSFLKRTAAAPASLLAAESSFLRGKHGSSSSSFRVAAILSSITLGNLLQGEAATAPAAPPAAVEAVEPKGHAFVPSDARTNTVVQPTASNVRAETPEEVIVVKEVGKPRKHGQSAQQPSKKRSLPVVEPHDYSKEQSLLDTPTSTSAPRPKKAKRERNGPRMPKPEGSKGGMSQTF